MPTPVDLVTDLPADFEVFGQAVDTSLADLKGGTSGQVLSKNSNTDMDFVWVTSDDANAIQNTIVDAKGDLIAATGSDTPARLAVGNDFLFVQALSSTSTGLTYGGNWQTWTPTFTNAVVGNGTVDARYQRFGNTIFLYINFTLGSTSSVSGDVSFSLPLGYPAARGRWNGSSYYLDAGVQSFNGSCEFAGAGGYFRVTNTAGTYANYAIGLNATTPFTWGTNDVMQTYAQYEVA
jgi:hypothetical protein